MKIRLYFLIATILISPLLFSDFAVSATLPRFSSSEESAKRLLLLAGAEQCVANDNALAKNPALGGELHTILTEPYKRVFVGAFANGEASGMMKCGDIFDALFNNATMTETMLNSTGLLNNVYNKQALTEKTLKCSYYIINNSGNAVYTNPEGTHKRFYWPQGFYSVGEKNRTSLNPTIITFNNNGFVKSTGTSVEVKDDLKNTFNQAFSAATDTAGNINFSALCPKIIKNVPLFYYQTGSFETAYSQPIHLLHSEDDTPFNEWGAHIPDENSAWLIYDNTSDSGSARRSFQHYINTTSTSTQLEKSPTAPAATFIANARSLLYAVGGGIASNTLKNLTPETYLSYKPNLAYILYGRYLFNGDNKMPFDSAGGGCGALTVSAADPNLSQLSAEEWDGSLSYASHISAYKTGADTTKSNFRASWFAVKNKKAVSIPIYPWSSAKIDCKDLASKFNSATATSSTVKETVKSYMNTATVNSGGTLVDSAGAIVGATGTPAGIATEVEPSKPTCDMGALGWVLCPIVHTLDNILGKIFEWIEHSLAIPSSFLNMGSGTYKAWEIFRNIANIIFIILLMITIFSQVTSVGISNYGIKKILPRLIIVGILINLSFFICQIAVDLSNILGAGLNAMLTNLVPPPTEITEKDFGFVGSTFATIGITGGAGLVLAALTGGWALFFAVGSFLLTSMVSLVMMFAALGFRQIGVVVLIAAAPVAMVCKLLPNTERIYGSWFKMLKGLLVLYPICGVLVGGGVMVGRVVATSGSEVIGSVASLVSFGASATADSSTSGQIVQILAALCVILPYFAVFSLTKKALDGLGMVGAAISGKMNGVESKMNSGIDNKLRKNNAFLNYKNQQRDITRSQAKGGVYRGQNPFYRLRNRLSNTGVVGRVRGKDYNRRVRATGLNASLMDHNQRVKDYAVFMDSLNTGREVHRELAAAHASGDQAGVQAGLAELAKRGDFSEIDRFLALDHSGDSALMQNTISSELIKNKQAAPHHWAYAVDMKKRSDGQQPVRSFRDFAEDGEDGLEKAISGVGDDALINMDRDVIKHVSQNGFGRTATGEMIPASAIFTEKQLRVAATSLTGDKLTALNGIIGGMEGRGARLVNGINAAQLGKVKSEVFTTITDGGSPEKIRALLSQEGSTLQTAIDDLFKEQNATLLGEMNPAVRGVIEGYRSPSPSPGPSSAGSPLGGGAPSPSSHDNSGVQVPHGNSDVQVPHGSPPLSEGRSPSAGQDSD
jgi:hypothetical protein